VDFIFSIPGLAPIYFDFGKKNWKAADACWDRDPYYGDNEPVLTFRNSDLVSDLERVLLDAKQAMQKHLEDRQNYELELNEKRERAGQQFEQQAQQEQERAESDLRNDLKQQQEKAEEQMLFDVIKEDPIAILMLKAYIKIQQERTGFTAQIEDANNSLYSMEEYWSSKAVELRHQADAAQRHAEEERYRLQNDLDDAESKVKKLEKQNRSW